MPDSTLRFTAIPSPDGAIRLPDDIARRAAGALTVEVAVTLHDDRSRLHERKVTPGELAAVAGAQRFDPEVAAFVLGGEGSVAADSPLGAALLRLLPSL